MPVTQVLFVREGERVPVYDLTVPARLREDHAEMGFWQFVRHQDVFVMSAEFVIALHLHAA
ncbi:hypothetical protein Deipe_4464 (plasmid) [Deinococcus peraridilitoris DSM 19664]|uniref:Uncharacterized protein n=1 Tax=Deinococcus peraridilitoris (strain DSM 19664 / LMG 22246 / CIP 109416 / KR-200) TaxID=937777 RepID=L0A8P1_DEIPD|nr:hypothetical protein Deipe_4464 [Deinococcus peraridilitoris DSM 19664]